MSVIVNPLITRTLGDLKTRIADELSRTDLTSQIALAVTQAIEEACTDHFWFMDTTGVLIPLAAGQSVYTGSSIANMLMIDRVRLFVASQQLTIRRMNDDELSRLADGSPAQGQPFVWSRNGDAITVYPTPTTSYNLYLDGVTKGAPLNSDSDSNIWTDPSMGEPLVRALAKRQIYADITRNDQQAMAMDKLAERYRAQLLSLTHDRLATNEMSTYGA